MNKGLSSSSIPSFRHELQRKRIEKERLFFYSLKLEDLLTPADKELMRQATEEGRKNVEELKVEAKDAKTIDLERYLEDDNYAEALRSANPLIQEALKRHESVMFDIIADHTDELGVSEGTLKKIIKLFGEDRIRDFEEDQKLISLMKEAGRQHKLKRHETN